MHRNRRCGCQCCIQKLYFGPWHPMFTITEVSIHVLGQLDVRDRFWKHRQYRELCGRTTCVLKLLLLLSAIFALQSISKTTRRCFLCQRGSARIMNVKMLGIFYEDCWFALWIKRGKRLANGQYCTIFDCFLNILVKSNPFHTFTYLKCCREQAGRPPWTVS